MVKTVEIQAQTPQFNEDSLNANHDVKIAEDVQNLLHRWWVYDNESQLADMASGRTNCIGFALVGSRELSDRGVEHYVGVANGHATILVPGQDERGQSTLFMRDMLSRRLNQDLAPAINRVEAPIANTNDVVARNGRAQMIVDGEMLALNASGYDHHNVGTEDIMNIHPWLRFNRSVYRPKTMLVLNLFSPEQGRELLVPYAHFMEAVRQSDSDGSADALLAMAGSYPDTDIRSTLDKAGAETPTVKIVQKLTKTLAVGGDFEKAQAVAAAFFDSFGSSEDTRVEEYRADCLRYIARAMKNAHDPRNWVTDQSRKLMEEARAVYSSIVDRPNAYKRSIMGKMAVCESMLSEL